MEHEHRDVLGLHTMSPMFMRQDAKRDKHAHPYLVQLGEACGYALPYSQHNEIHTCSSNKGLFILLLTLMCTCSSLVRRLLQWRTLGRGLHLRAMHMQPSTLPRL